MIVRHLGFEAYDLLPTEIKRAIQHSVDDINSREVYFTWIEDGVDKALKLVEYYNNRSRQRMESHYG
jgi:uncharacterized protein YprB with RNaseH-like and TPR domain